MTNNGDFSTFKMPWGEFQDFEIEDIPSRYLYWLAENSKDDYIATLADKEWAYRELHDKHFYEVEEE